MTYPNRVKAAAAAVVATAGGLAAIALTSTPDATPDPAAAPLKRPPVEVRTKVIRRTIHRVKRERPEPGGTPPTAAASPAAAAVPVPAVRPAPVQPAAAAPPVEPVTTRTSGAARAEDDDSFEAEDHEAEHESFEAEHEDD